MLYRLPLLVEGGRAAVPTSVADSLLFDAAPRAASLSAKLRAGELLPTASIEGEGFSSGLEVVGLLEGAVGDMAPARRCEKDFNSCSGSWSFRKLEAMLMGLSAL